jgi:type IV secretory pathway VirJ component
VRPILVGYSSGATVVYGALAQAPPTTFRGAVSLGFCPDLEVKKPFCGTKQWKPGWDDKKKQSWLPETADMPEREGGGTKWIALQGLIDQVCAPPQTVAFVGRVPHSEVISLEKVGHGFSVPSRWGASFDHAVTDLLEPASVLTPLPHVVHQAADYESPEDIAAKLDALDLPLETVWPATPQAVLIFVSGDGGWAELDDSVAHALAEHGVAVVGWNALRYFWLAKSPQRFSEALGKLVDALPRDLPVFAGGYSFGAETISIVVAESKASSSLARIAGLVLLAPGTYATFEVSPLDWIRSGDAPTEHSVTRALGSLDRLPVLCVEPKGSEESGCAIPARPRWTRLTLPGGHHFDHDYETVSSRAAEFISANSPR